jgi:hypothetical protein
MIKMIKMINNHFKKLKMILFYNWNYGKINQIKKIKKKY